MPAHDEHRVRNTHLCRITHMWLVCPAKVSHVAAGLPSRLGQPCRTQLSGGSTASCRASCAGRCWQSHQVPPGQSSWWRFRHGRQIMVPIVPSRSGWLARADVGTTGA